MSSKLNAFVALAFLAMPSNVDAEDVDVRVARQFMTRSDRYSSYCPMDRSAYNRCTII
jgi:hypothetical protein